MSGNCAVLVDAGFLMAEGSEALGRTCDNLAFDGDACVAWCTAFFGGDGGAHLTSISGRKSFLRAYWYDAAYDPADRRYRRQPEQFDALMTLDMVSLARDRAVDAILLVSGDRDLEEAVRVAQGVGCKVVLAHPPAAGVSLALRQLADARLSIEANDLQRVLVPVRPVVAA